VFKLKDYPQGQDEKEMMIPTEEELRRVLGALQVSEPRFVDLIAPSGGCLTIGIGRPLACVIYTQAFGRPPYLTALGNMDDQEGFVEFDAGGTPTEIPANQCIPYDEMVNVAVYFFNNESLPQNVRWDET
jgi:hypothetical protein